MDENKAGFLSSLRQFGRKWLVHLVICIGFIYVFSHMSLMRPLIPKPFYMEYVVAIFVLLFLYLHYFLFIPKFLLQKKYALYFIIALGSALVWSCCEVGFLYSKLHDFFYANFPSEIQFELFKQDIITQSMRNLALLAFFVLLGLYENAVREEESMKKESAKQLHLLHVKDRGKKDCFIEIPQLLYCQQVKNYTHYYTGTDEYTSLTTLKEIKELIGDECVQVGRSFLVMRHAIQEQNDAYITLRNPSNPGEPIVLSVK